MHLFNKSGATVLLCVIALTSLTALGQPRSMTEGTHYFPIDPPIATRASQDSIEILDVFWYGCPLCREFEPMMTYYGGEIRGDLVMRRMPAAWNPAMLSHARVYFTAGELGIAKQAHRAAFAYIQEQHMQLNTMAQAQAFFATLGVASSDFASAWQSDRVSAQLAQAQRDTVAANIDQLPALVVNGRYKVIRNAEVPELTELVITTNQLIALLRNERRSD